MTIPAQARSQPRPRLPLGAAGTLVDNRIKGLQAGYLADRSEAVATLARLRRGAGKDAHAMTDLWGLLDTGPLYDAGLPEQDLARSDEAVHVTMTLWALHQQARSRAMHHPGGPELGFAVGKLMKPGEIDEPVLKRFRRAGAASSLSALAVRLREIVLLLRRDEISLDYALLADQLYRWQRPGGRDEVRRAWGRSFHAHRPPGTTEPAAAQNPDHPVAVEPETEDIP